MLEKLVPGLFLEDTFVVGEEHSAAHVGSGTLRVLATPWMIAIMERTARRLVGEHLPEGYTSLGVQVNVRHLAPSPVGGSVHVRAEVLAVDGLRVSLGVRAWDSQEEIGAGEHQRVVVDEQRFLKRVASKQSPPGEA